LYIYNIFFKEVNCGGDYEFQFPPPPHANDKKGDPDPGLGPVPALDPGREPDPDSAMEPDPASSRSRKKK
jgi:hypothetical protein